MPLTRPVDDPLQYMRDLYRVNRKRGNDKAISAELRMKIQSSLVVVKFVLDKLEAGCSPTDAMLAARLRFNSPNRIRTMNTLDEYLLPGAPTDADT